MTLLDFAEYVARNNKAGIPLPSKLTASDAHAAALTMIERGGSFAKSIGTAYLHADGHNAEILREAFADLFKSYRG